jgi:hypothetical protein
MDAKYAPVDLKAIAAKCKHLTTEEQKMLQPLLTAYKPLFDGTLGSWNTDPIDIELKELNTKPYHVKPYPVPYSQEQKL